MELTRKGQHEKVEQEKKGGKRRKRNRIRKPQKQSKMAYERKDIHGWCFVAQEWAYHHQHKQEYHLVQPTKV